MKKILSVLLAAVMLLSIFALAGCQEEKSSSLSKKEKYEYIQEHFDNKDKKTYKYLKELKEKEYEDCEELYDELYSWKASICVNTTQDGTEDLSEILLTEENSTYYIHFRLSGGTPDEEFKGECEITFSDGAATWSDCTGKDDGEVVSVSVDAWAYAKGETTITLYDEDGNTVTSKMINVVDQQEDKEDESLIAAKDYLYALYAGPAIETKEDYTLVSQVNVNGIFYPVEWTVDVDAEIVNITSTSNNVVLVDITADNVDIYYTLTATLYNDDGESVSVSFDRMIPAEKEFRGNIVIYNPAEEQYVTGFTYFNSDAGRNEQLLSAYKGEAAVMKMIENSDGTFSFIANEHYLYCDGNSVQFSSTRNDYTKFVLEKADDANGHFIKCAYANYYGKPQYLEIYGGNLTSYGMDIASGAYIFELRSAE
jgi:hypothetical protein